VLIRLSLLASVVRMLGFTLYSGTQDGFNLNEPYSLEEAGYVQLSAFLFALTIYRKFNTVGCSTPIWRTAVRNRHSDREKILQGPVPQWESEERARADVRATRKLPRVVRGQAGRSSVRAADVPGAAAIRGSPQ